MRSRWCQVVGSKSLMDSRWCEVVGESRCCEAVGGKSLVGIHEDKYAIYNIK